MHSTLITLINRLDSSTASGAGVIEWGSPVPAFGDPSVSRVATLGLNPSNREFVDASGCELLGKARRFHTLSSLGIESWSQVDARHVSLILESCRDYFYRRPFDAWFRKLDYLVLGANASYYDNVARACHLDLVPFATARKWSSLSAQQRSSLMALACDSLGLLLRDSPIRLLILNGRTVVEQFQVGAGVHLHRQEMPTWSLPRKYKPPVAGFAYRGVVDNFKGISFGRKILVIGYNHNLQSSYGVTMQVVHEIKTWITQVSKEA